MIELKHCPFCGKKQPELRMQRNEMFRWIHCECGSDGPPDLGESGAIEQWNTRPRENDLQSSLAVALARIRELEDMLLTEQDDSDNRYEIESES